MPPSPVAPPLCEIRFFANCLSSMIYQSIIIQTSALLIWYMYELKVGETGDGRYKIYISHHISLMKKLSYSILGVPFSHYVYYNLKHTKHENIN